jgi:hypothetical protein
MGVEALVQDFGEVLYQGDAIGDLARGGSALPGPVRRSSGSVPGAHADTGMGVFPEGEGLGLALGSEGERPTLLAIDQRGPIDLAFPVSPLVAAEPLGGRHSWHGQTAPQAQAGMPTDDQAETTAQSCPCRPAQRQGDGRQLVCKLRRPSRPGG